MKATLNGKLNEIPDCTIFIPNAGTIRMKALPDISDGKSAVYNNEGIMGRSFPLYTYSYSGDRTLSIQLHFYIVKVGDGSGNLRDLRRIQSAVYPRRGDNGAPYTPPPICTIKCGSLIALEPVCALLQSYNVKFPTDVAWEENTYCPFRFDVDTNWLIVYTSADLPFQSRIVGLGR